jgi:hypothetical protein
MPSFNSATSIMRSPRIHRQHLRPWNHAPAWGGLVRSPSGGVRAFGNPGVHGLGRVRSDDEEIIRMMGLGWLGQDDGGDGGGDGGDYPQISYAAPADPNYGIGPMQPIDAPNIIDTMGTPLDNAGTPALISELNPQVQQANINELIASAPGTLTPQEVADIYAGQPISAADMSTAGMFNVPGTGGGTQGVKQSSGGGSSGGGMSMNQPSPKMSSPNTSALTKALQSLISPSGTVSTGALSAAQLAALQAAGVPYMGGALTAAQQAVLAGGSSASILPGISNTTLLIGGALLIGAALLFKK